MTATSTANIDDSIPQFEQNTIDPQIDSLQTTIDAIALCAPIRSV